MVPFFYLALLQGLIVKQQSALLAQRTGKKR